MSHESNHCSFVLLAEFDILEGAALKYQFPQPLGIDEVLLAMLMLPDGADTQLDDWTMFFLNQTPFNTISPVLALEDDPTPRVDGNKPELLCVLNLVRTKHDKNVERGARVRAMAICTRHPFIQIFKPVLLMAMDHYFSEPSQDCLGDLFDAVNAMDLSGAPVLTRNEKIVMRCSERKDIFAEKLFRHQQHQQKQASNGHAKHNSGHSDKTKSHTSSHSADSKGSFEDGVSRSTEDPYKESERVRDRSADTAAVSSLRHKHVQTPPSDSSFSLGGAAVWVGDESGLEDVISEGHTNESSTSLLPSSKHAAGTNSSRGRRSTDASSSSHSSQNKPIQYGLGKDTHFYHATIHYKGHQLPIKMPLATFPEEVGDYTLIPLIKTFSSHQLVSGPIHPQLHTGGPQTHPIIILFNALVTGKRIIFMGHKRPAGQVSNFVLSACALGSGCGVVLRGFIERAFPYANLNNKDEWESVSGYIAGVTNLIFQSTGLWDVLFDIASGQVIVHRDIHINWPYTPGPGLGVGQLTSRTGTLKAEGSLGSDDMVKQNAGKDARDKGQQGESADSVFIEDIRAAIEFHFGESLVRTRFMEYVQRFVRIAARYESETSGVTKIGFSSATFTGSANGRPQLGSGVFFSDENAGLRELAANANRIEGWKKTNTYQNAIADFNKLLATSSMQGFDVVYQFNRLRYAKHMPASEVELMMNTIADNCKTYHQVVELLAHMHPQSGGLTQLCFGLFHPLESVRTATLDILDQLRKYPVGVIFLQSLNHFQRYAYVRQSHARAAGQRRVESARSPTTPGTLHQAFLYPPENPPLPRKLSNSSGESNVGAAI